MSEKSPDLQYLDNYKKCKNRWKDKWMDIQYTIQNIASHSIHSSLRQEEIKSLMSATAITTKQQHNKTHLVTDGGVYCHILGHKSPL